MRVTTDDFFPEGRGGFVLGEMIHLPVARETFEKLAGNAFACTPVAEFAKNEEVGERVVDVGAMIAFEEKDEARGLAAMGRIKACLSGSDQ